MDRGRKDVHCQKGLDDFCATRGSAHLSVPWPNTGSAHVRHHPCGFRRIFRGNRSSKPAATAGHPQRDGDREKIWLGNPAAARSVSRGSELQDSVVQIEDLSRHTESAAAGNALRGHLCQSPRKACLLRHYSQRGWTTFRAVDSNPIAPYPTRL